MNGILLGIGKINNLNGISLLGETSGYVIDANASKYILMKLLSIVDLDIDMGDLEKKATRIERYCQKHFELLIKWQFEKLSNCFN